MDDDRDKFPSEAADRFQVRMPPGLRGRIKEVAESNNRSMNAEIVATLEEKYPPDSIDIETLSKFLFSFSVLEGQERREWIDQINDALAASAVPYTIRAGSDGVVKAFPYASPNGTLFKTEDDEE
jgi:hypothetical protein